MSAANSDKPQVPSDPDSSVFFLDEDVYHRPPPPRRVLPPDLVLPTLPPKTRTESLNKLMGMPDPETPAIDTTRTSYESEDTLSDDGEFEEMLPSRVEELKTNCNIRTTTTPRSRIVDRKGTLYMQSRRWIKWKQYLVDFSSGELQIYASEKSSVTKRIIPAVTMANVTQDIKINETHPYRFILTTVDRNYTFATDTADDLTLWTQVLMQAIVCKQEQFKIGGEMSNATKEGLVKMEGVKGKRYLAIKRDKFCYYNTIKDFEAATPIYRVEMKLAMVKKVGQTKLQLITPYTSCSFVFMESHDELEDWKNAFEKATEYGLGDDSVLLKVYENHNNRLCADCCDKEPQWAAVNMGLTLCKRCAGVHRGLSSISKVRSLRMDFNVWTEPLIKMFNLIGNEAANSFWEKNWNSADSDRIRPETDDDLRKQYIHNKYVLKKFAQFHPLKDKDQEALNEALCKAVTFDKVVETMQLLFSGADLNYRSSNDETPLVIAQRCRQLVQEEFLMQNGADGSRMVVKQIQSVPDPTSPGSDYVQTPGTQEEGQASSERPSVPTPDNTSSTEAIPRRKSNSGDLNTTQSVPSEGRKTLDKENGATDMEPEYVNLNNCTRKVPEKPPEGAAVVQRSSDGWEKYMDASTNTPFYFHPEKGVSQWDTPKTWKPSRLRDLRRGIYLEN